MIDLASTFSAITGQAGQGRDGDIGKAFYAPDFGLNCVVVNLCGRTGRKESIVAQRTAAINNRPFYRRRSYFISI